MKEFETLFTIAGTFGVTLWVVTFALLTIVLGNMTVGHDLGTLSVRVREALQVAASSEKMTDELRSALGILFGQYRATWFTVEALPIPVYFQVAMLLSLCALIPRVSAEWLSCIPVLHIAAWTGFIALLKKNDRRVTAAIKKACPEVAEGEKLADAQVFGRRVVLWELPLIAFGIAIFWCGAWGIVGSVLASIILGMIRTLHVTANLTIAPAYNATAERLQTPKPLEQSVNKETATGDRGEHVGES